MRFVFVLGFAIAACVSAATTIPASAAQTAPMGATRMMPGTPDMVAPALIEEMTERQYFLTDRTATSLAFDRPIDNAALWASTGGSPEALPHARVIMTLTPMGRQTRVTADMIVMGPKSHGHAEQVADDKLSGLDPRMGSILEGASTTVLAQAASATQVASASGQR